MGGTTLDSLYPLARSNPLSLLSKKKGCRDALIHYPRKKASLGKKLNSNHREGDWGRYGVRSLQVT